MTLYAGALAIREHVFGAASAEVGTTLDGIATVHAQCGAHATAVQLYTRALAIHEQVFGSDSAQVGGTLHNLGVA